MDTTPHESPGSSNEPPPQTPPDSPAGTPTGNPTGNPAGNRARLQRLHRDTRGRMLAGVASGVADYFDVDPTLVRIGFVALAFPRRAGRAALPGRGGS